MSNRRVKLNLERKTAGGPDRPYPLLCFYVNPAAAPFIRALTDYQEKTRKIKSPFYSVTIDVPYKARTTGKKSQNHAINGFVGQIANALGFEFEDVKKYAKQRALKYGYPVAYTEDGKTKLDPWGNTMGISETEISTIEAGYFIEALHEIAAENGVILKEENIDE